jgi:ATP-dependent DNA helicase RecQ
MNNEFLELMKKCLENIDCFEGAFRSFLEGNPQKDDIEIATCYRVLRSLKDLLSDKEVTIEFLANIRQACSLFNRNFKVDEKIVKLIKSKISNLTKYGINILEFSSGYYIEAENMILEWFGDTEVLDGSYSSEMKKINNFSTGDLFLYKLIGEKRYLNIYQKLGVFLTTNLEEGQTLLICMPTGYGKSLVWQYISFFEEEGLTVCVVPTISLALDQQRRAEEIKKRIAYPKYVYAYHSGLDDIEKRKIYRDLKNKNVSILYISPEAILNTSFKNVLMQLASEKNFKRLVIDECHIVSEWGALFRTDFQFLSIFRKKILEASEGKLLTILLSATLTQQQTEILKKLFSEDFNFLQIRADALRDEFVFFIEECKSDEERKKKVLEILPYLRRPIIIYFNSPENVEDWEKFLTKEGYRYIEKFTGKTQPSERREILHRWNENQIDIMLATSAFGMGVDKKDIRTIIHCYIPESVNRFYQEVGRAGRDHKAAISFWFFNFLEDKEELNNITKSKIAKTDTIAARWRSMLEERDQDQLDTIWINMDTTPYYIGNKITGASNVTWNEHTILFLLRHNFIDIVDIDFDDTKNYKLSIRPKKIDLFQTEEEIREKIEQFRKKEREEIKEQATNVLKFLKRYKKVCIGEILISVYPHAGLKCQGCPYCKRNDLPSIDESYLKPIFTQNIRIKTKLSDKFWTILRNEKEIFLEIPESIDNMEIKQRAEIINTLLETGFNCFVFHDCSLVEEIFDLLSFSGTTYMFLSYDEANMLIDSNISFETVCIFYTQDHNVSTKLYNMRKKLINNGSKVINISTEKLFLPREGKKLTSLVDGSVFKYNWVIKWR